MSQHNTMSSNISDLLAQQQKPVSQSFSHQPQRLYSDTTTNSNGRMSVRQSSLDVPIVMNRHSLTNTSIRRISKSNSLTNSITSGDKKKNDGSGSNVQQDPRSPLVILIPTNSQPTEILASRFNAWKSIIKSLICYLTEFASVQDEIVRHNLRLLQAINFPFLTIENQYQPVQSQDKLLQNFFIPFGNGSIQDLPTILTNYHNSMAAFALKVSKELTSDLIPRLEDLRSDLSVKIKEIKSLESDFKNTCDKQLVTTKNLLNKFQESIDDCRYGNMKKMNDPYLNKIILDKQIKKQLTEENFLHEAYNNLETSGSELEKVIVMEIQNAITIYARLSGQESQLVFNNLITTLDAGILAQDISYEWDSFIKSNLNNFVAPNLPMRKFNEIKYKHDDSPINHELYSSFLEKRSKYLKNYSNFFFVLSANYLHEFKTADRKNDLVPTMSIPISEILSVESPDIKDSAKNKKNSHGFKLTIQCKNNSLINRATTIILKTESYNTLLKWYNHLRNLMKLSNDYNKKSEYIKKYIIKDSQPPLSQKTIHSAISPSITISPTSRNLSMTTTNDTINDDDMDADTSLPRLDNQTNTITTISSIPETNESQLKAIVPPNIYIRNVDESPSTTLHK